MRYMVFVLLLALTTFSCEPQRDLKQASNQQQRGMEQLLGNSLLPSPSEEQLVKSQVLALDLAQTIEKFDGVAEARVHIYLADTSLLSRDRQAESQAAVLVRRLGNNGPNEAKVRAFVLAAIPGLKSSNVSVFFSGSQQEPALKTVFVGPIEVAVSSASTAKICLGGLLVLSLVLAIGLIGAGLKLRANRLKR